uniref:hydroxymethylpyrimidine kinase n=1 Tax=Chlorobium chlorochromatii (strain CaD3) TaxID=340177 RepID=Q3ASE2_CHLCH
MKRYTTVLTIAGSDGSGGAGIQADLKTFAALRCYGVSVITAITAQNTQGVSGVFPVENHCLQAQFEALQKDITFDAIKIGMLGSASTITTLAALLRALPTPRPPIILDTVLASSSGMALLPPSAIACMVSKLFPLATLITPNIPECALLAGKSAVPQTAQEIEAVAKELQAQGAASVLIKGGHGKSNECHDCLLWQERCQWFSAPMIATHNTHGTGCTLSSAIAAFMAKGYPLDNAVLQAKNYLNSALQAGAAYQLGMSANGHGPLFHLWELEDE